ncbi:MAG: restriction endonuclease subunit S [Clostridia bacterium]|nr:restriction endonuclease subunit S [Clostridia bacterium]MBO5525167.1 restriction endonuclease subunit S [Clostridia bacterium]
MISEIKQRITQLNNGEVPNGYKKTEFGIFPCDWVKDKTFGDLFDFYGGLGKSREELGEEGHAYLHYGDLHRGSFNVVSHEQYDQLPKYDVALKGKETYLMEDGDVAFLDASEDLDGTSRSVLVDNPDNKPFIAGLHIIFGKSKDNSLEKWYKQYITSSESVRKQFQRLAAGFKVYGVNRDTLPRIQVAYPKSTEEQSKIAEILMKWDKAIELQEKTIEKLHTKRDAVVQRVIKKKEGWHKEILSNILVERTEFATKEDGYPHASLTMDGVTQKTDRYNRDFLVKSDDKKYKVTHYNDICYNPANLKFGVICVNKYENDAIFSPIYITYEVNPQYNTDFIGSILCSADFIRYIRKYEEGTVYERQAVKSSDLLRGVIWVPDTKEEQDQIASIISEINTYIQKQVDYCNSLKQQRKALQQYLLNGIVRV